jgi:hypothetical protein
MSPIVSRPAALALLAALITVPLLAFRHPPASIRTGGTFTMTYTQQQVTPMGDVEGHIVIAGQAAGTGRSAGASPFMDGAVVTQVSLTELTQGSGPDQGYIVESKDGETSSTRYTGSVKTVPGPDGQPLTTFEGTWTKLGGSGRYAGVTGAGRYRGRMTAPNASVIEWEGEIRLRQAAGTAR